MNEQLKEIADKNNVKILQQHHSALEHRFTWIVDAKEAHSVENFMLESGWGKI